MTSEEIRIANRLEELAVVMKDLTKEIREGLPRRDTYTRLYWLRRDMGRMVTDMGAGQPGREAMYKLDDQHGIYT